MYVFIVLYTVLTGLKSREWGGQMIVRIASSLRYILATVTPLSDPIRSTTWDIICWQWLLPVIILRSDFQKTQVLGRSPGKDPPRQPGIGLCKLICGTGLIEFFINLFCHVRRSYSSITKINIITLEDPDQSLIVKCKSCSAMPLELFYLFSRAWDSLWQCVVSSIFVQANYE